MNLLEILVTVTAPLENKFTPLDPLLKTTFLPRTFMAPDAPRELFWRSTPFMPLSLAVRLLVEIAFFELISKPVDPLLLKTLLLFKVTGAMAEAPELSMIAPSPPLFDALNPLVSTVPLDARFRPVEPLLLNVSMPFKVTVAEVVEALLSMIAPTLPLFNTLNPLVSTVPLEARFKPVDPLKLNVLRPIKVTDGLVPPELSMFAPVLPLFKTFNPKVSSVPLESRIQSRSSHYC